MRTAISILKILASWPVVALILALIFKEKIGNLLDRLKKAGQFEWGQSPADEVPKDKIPIKSTHGENETATHDHIKWENVANIYWAGHDLMWTCDVLLRGAPRDTILWGLSQSLHHIREIGLGGDPVEGRLSRLLTDARTMLEKDWTLQMRNSYAQEILSIREYAGSLMNNHQKDFRRRPD